MRRLAAVLACRSGSSRLYCKPLQNLAPGVTILDQIVETLRSKKAIGDIVLAISEGIENECFRDYARRHGLAYCMGDERDVLSRLIRGGRLVGATDVFRVTTESPFQWHDPIEALWDRHVARANDITVTDSLPIGSHFEIYTLAALARSHENGTERHRSELCSLYAREHLEEFQVEAIWPDEPLRRRDIRLTVDFPEDLIVCRDLFEALGRSTGRIDLAEVIRAYDATPRLAALMAELPRSVLFWDGAPVLDWSSVN
ncbi:cytidylyltransferase domain-containing protein [Alsobacter sp. R-9]